jgi:hypothetical protein
MKMSEIIEVLQQLQNEHGDLQVGIRNSEFFTHSSHICFELIMEDMFKDEYYPDHLLDEPFISISG